jgi:hypothetical protein
MSCKHCSGPCDQGRKPCPTPQACEIETTEERLFRLMGVAVMTVGVIVVLVLVLA